MVIRRTSLSLALATGLLVAACSPLTASPPPTVAAVVDDADVTIAELDAQIDALLDVPAFAAELEAQPALRSQVETVLLSLLIQRQLFTEGAAALDVAVAQTDIDERIALQAGSEDPEEIAMLLEMQGISLEFAALQSELELLLEGVSETVTADGELDDAALRTVYERLYLEAPTARHILLEDAERAEDVLARLADGEDFGALAVEVSIDPSAEINEGELGPITAEQFDADFANAVFEADDGEVIGPVETQFGFHVIERLEPPTFEEVREDVLATAEADAGEVLTEAWIGDLFADAEIVVNPRFGRWEPAINEVVSASPLDRPSPLARSSESTR